MTKHLTDDQEEILILGALAARGERGLTEVEGQCILDWANQAVINWDLLQLALKNKLQLGWKNDDLVTHQVKGTKG